MVSPNPSSKNAPYDIVSGRLVAQGVSTANVFEHAYRHLVNYRNVCQVYHVLAYANKNPEIDVWANHLLKTLWTATTGRDPG